MSGGAQPIGDAYARGLGRARRRAAGAFYTPADLVEYVVGETLAPVLARARWRADGTPAIRILDPACGDGRFLIACVDHILRARRSLRERVVARCVVGVERDLAAAAIARRALGPDADVRVGEALLGNVAEDGAWDAIVGNPPYLRSVALKRTDPLLWTRLRGAFAATSYREWDLYAAFLQRSLRWAAPCGEIGLVVPSRWLTAQFAAPLRRELAAARAVRTIVDFSAAQLFPDATTYASLVFLTRRSGGAPHVDVARWIGAAGAVPGMPPARAVPSSSSARPANGWRQGRVRSSTLGAAPWALDVGVVGRRLARLAASAPALGEIARIAKGAGSNADPVFLLRPDTTPGWFWSDALRERVAIEPAALVPCLRGRDVRPFVATVVRQALLPYSVAVDDAANATAALWDDATLARFPLAAAYLERCRALLDARERGRFAGPRFYRWGRPQNLAWHLDPTPKIIVPDAAAEGRAALDTSGTLVIDTAYAIRPIDPTVSIDRILAVLNSPLVAEWLRNRGIPLRGGYFRMKTAYLASMPIPDRDGRRPNCAPNSLSC